MKHIDDMGEYNDRDGILYNIREYNRRRKKDLEEAKNYYNLCKNGKELLKNIIDFSDTEFLKILNMFKPNGREWRHGKYSVEEKEKNGIRYIHGKMGNPKCSIIIFKLEDEWYLVALGDSTFIYFLCDQIEGLEYFLEGSLYLKE